MKIVITTDSVLNPRDMENMVPCIINGDKESYYDMKKICNDDIRAISNIEVFERALSGEKFKTASPSIEDFMKVMSLYIEEGYDVIHLAASKGISEGSLNGAYAAANTLSDIYNKEITVIDTMTGGCGGTIINDYANDLVRSNLPKDEIVNKLNEVKKHILATFYISKVEGFVRSGRAPKAANLFDRFSLRYRIDINDGKLHPKIPPYRGSIQSGFMKYLKSVINENNKDSFDPNYLALLITRLNEIDINAAKEYLESLNYFDKKLIKELPFYSAISSYGVEDQVGLALIKKH